MFLISVVLLRSMLITAALARLMQAFRRIPSYLVRPLGFVDL